jgi:hypothetical protein
MQRPSQGSGHPPHSQNRFAKAAACAAICLFALYPISVVVAINVRTMPLNSASLVRFGGGSIIAALGLVLLLRFVQRDFVTRALWVSWTLALFSAYRVGLGTLGYRTVGVQLSDWRVAVLYTAGAAVLATAIVRPWGKVRRRDPIPLLMFGVLLHVPTLWSIASARSEPWRSEAEALARPAGMSVSQPESQLRNIYYIVVDAFGRGDILKQYYGVDLSEFESYLTSRGFYVPRGARSNYSQTFLSLASTLNLDYLDSLADVVGTDSVNRRPLGFLIHNSELIQLAQRRGYRVTVIGSDYPATMSMGGADECVCHQYGMDEFEQAALQLTPLASLPLRRWAVEAHREKVVASFDALEQTVSSSLGHFVFAHIISPHPPFVLGAAGQTRPARPTGYIFDDGSDFDGSHQEYVDGYGAQAMYVSDRLKRFVAKALAQPGPRPVIIFHGDHGPGSMLRWEEPSATNLLERMAIFEAYYLPGRGPQPYESMSPVNGTRLLASRYLGVNSPLLPDKAAFSRWSRPYDFIAVPEASASK